MSGLENAALNGDLFRPRSHSPSHSIDSVDSHSSRGSNDSSALRRGDSKRQDQAPLSNSAQRGSKTGVKGVLADSKVQARDEKLQREIEKMLFIRQQEDSALIGNTIDEEEAFREREELVKQYREEMADKDDLSKNGIVQVGEEAGEEDVKERWRRQRMRELRGGGNGVEGGGGVKKRGLREVGKEGFLAAVERSGWTVVLIYEPDVPRCTSLLTSMISLSLSLPPTSPLTLLRARATSLGFSLKPKVDPEDEEEIQEADLDVLPTLLAYKSGELEKTWVRVDWEIKEDGMEGLLKREGILSSDVVLGLDADEHEDEYYD